MWIAKPLGALSQEEEASWSLFIKHRLNNKDEPPLSQSLAWGRAIQAVSGRAYAVFSPDDGVGGLVHEDAGRLECVNGPLLDWDDPASAARQVATFAAAAAKLQRDFASLTLRPRWHSTRIAARLAGLPLPARSTSTAATLRLALSGNPESGFAPRLRKTLRASDLAGVAARHEPVGTQALVEFVVAAQGFGRSRGFTVPPVLWFRALTESARPHEALSFKLVTAHTPQGDSGCQLLIAWNAHEAHYLFGHEWRSDGLRAAVSLSAVAHRCAIREAARAGLLVYDFNGTLEDPSPDHPYAGVAAFKKQFGGSVVSYSVPELRIDG